MTEGVFSHKDTKFYYARVLLQSPTAPASSRRKPSFDLCEHRGRAHYVRKKSSRWKFFGAIFFSKKVAKQNNRIPQHKRRAYNVR